MPSARRPPERARMTVVDRADLTCVGDADFLFVRTWMPEPESYT
jgi:hypothetical protein